ncbi:MAG: hypothetical protein JST66_04105 [Bacteroidetes bacterium]|nr:hypothetical protein [Bacteroidota bacterium]
MRVPAIRSACASVLLVLAVFTVLPRTLFHHCERILTHAEAGDPANGGVHRDTHCAICEAPVPVHEGAFALSFTMDEVELGMGASPCIVLPPTVPAEAPRLRGPPALA